MQHLKSRDHVCSAACNSDLNPTTVLDAGIMNPVDPPLRREVPGGRTHTSTFGTNEGVSLNGGEQMLTGVALSP